MLLLKLPGVSCPDDDTALLIDALLEEFRPNARVLDLGVAHGSMAGLLEQAGADDTVALDLRRGWVRQRLRGSWWAPRLGTFDLVVANVPFLCAGLDTQMLLGRICRDAPGRLAEGGALWLVYSGLLDSGAPRRVLEEAGLSVEFVESREVVFGPAMWSRAAALRSAGVIEADQCTENLVLVRARRV